MTTRGSYLYVHKLMLKFRGHAENFLKILMVSLSDFKRFTRLLVEFKKQFVPKL